MPQKSQDRLTFVCTSTILKTAWFPQFFQISIHVVLSNEFFFFASVIISQSKPTQLFNLIFSYP